ncbi:GTP-binding protein, partial [Rhizobium ruizarguesonis]
ATRRPSRLRRTWLRDRGESRDGDDERKLVELLVEQIEFADVVVINKAQDVPPAALAEVRRIVAGLNPDARVIETGFGRLKLDAILNTGLFSEARAARHPLWHKELFGWGEHVPETEEFGISSFVYRSRRPFDPSRLRDFLDRKWSGLIRAKGHFWLATRPDEIGLLSITGTQCRIDTKGFWWASVPKAQWPRYTQFHQLIDRHWDEVWGDRRQELVFIGAGFDEDAIRTALGDCLTGEETGFDPQTAAGLRDPFPAWQHAHSNS